MPHHHHQAEVVLKPAPVPPHICQSHNYAVSINTAEQGEHGHNNRNPNKQN